MFTEGEISTMAEDPMVFQAAIELKREFLEKEAPMMKIADHDFFSLIMLSPSIGMALANGSISLFEELSLNKKARRFSKGGYFLKLDPVVHAMKFLISNFSPWEDRFYAVIRLVMERFFSLDRIDKTVPKDLLDDESLFTRCIMQTPYAFIKALPSFFLPDNEDITNIRSISKVEFDKLVEIGNKLGLAEYVVFQKFCETFEIK